MKTLEQLEARKAQLERQRKKLASRNASKSRGYPSARREAITSLNKEIRKLKAERYESFADARAEKREKYNAR